MEEECMDKVIWWTGALGRNFILLPLPPQFFSLILFIYLTALCFSCPTWDLSLSFFFFLTALSHHYFMWIFSALGVQCLSLQWLLLLWSTGSRGYGLSSGGAWPGLPHSMWNLAGAGIEPKSPAWAGWFFTTEPPGKSMPPGFLTVELYLIT